MHSAHRVAPLLAPWTGDTGDVDLILLGAYYAATDGVLMALASAVLPPEQRAGAWPC
jgi:hypothetical protein